MKKRVSLLCIFMALVLCFSGCNMNKIATAVLKELAEELNENTTEVVSSEKIEYSEEVSEEVSEEPVEAATGEYVLTESDLAEVNYYLEHGTEPEKVRTAYFLALVQLLNEHVLPDGREIPYIAMKDDPSGQSFGKYMFFIADVNQDKRAELVIYNTAATNEARLSYIYEYKLASKTCELLLEADSDLTFYDDGTVIVNEWNLREGSLARTASGTFQYYRWDAEGGYVLMSEATSGDQLAEDDEYQAFQNMYYEGRTDQIYYDTFWLTPSSLAFARCAKDFDTTLMVLEQYRIPGTTESSLSFQFLGDTLKDMDDYYEIEALFDEAYKVSGDLKVGERITLELSGFGCPLTIEKTSEHGYTEVLPDGTLSDYEAFYSYGDSSDMFETLYQDSDDVVCGPFFRGTLRIYKNAQMGYAIEDNYWTVTRIDLERQVGYWNGVSFDGRGYVTDIKYYGD